MKYILNTILITLLLASSAGSYALDHTKQEQISKQLLNVLPDLKIDNIIETPLPNIYQVTAGQIVLYTSDDGRFLIYGEIIDTSLAKEKWNLTEQARRQNKTNLLKSINLEDKIIYKPKETKAVITIFTDLNCKFCKKLHKEVPELLEQGIEVHYLAFPRGGQNTNSYKKALHVWCAKDRNKAMDLAKSGKKIALTECETDKIASQYQLGKKLGLRATPIIILEDGAIITGYMPAAKLAPLAIQHVSKR